MKNLSKKLWDMYEKAVNVEYTLGALKRSEEQSIDFEELRKEHIYEMVGALDLLRASQCDFVSRLNDICEEFEKMLLKESEVCDSPD